MRTINLINDIAQFHEYFSELKEKQNTIVIWQLDKLSNKRIIYHSFINDIQEDSTTVSCNTSNDETYQFNPGDLFFYIETTMTIFKSEQVSTQNNFLSIKYPEELKFLDEMEDDKIKAVFSAINPSYVKETPKYHTLESDKEKGYTFVGGEKADKENPDWERVEGGGRKEKLNSMWEGALNQHDQDLFAEELSFITLDEEDKIYEGQRTAPRAKPPEGKLVTVQISDESRPQETLPLHDLSQGGIGFLVFNKDAYNSGEVIYIKGFDTKKFDSPMFAVVRSVREADEMGIQFKVGLQFITDPSQA